MKSTYEPRQVLGVLSNNRSFSFDGLRRENYVTVKGLLRSSALTSGSGLRPQGCCAAHGQRTQGQIGQETGERIKALKADTRIFAGPEVGQMEQFPSKLVIRDFWNNQFVTFFGSSGSGLLKPNCRFWISSRMTYPAQDVCI